MLLRLINADRVGGATYFEEVDPNGIETIEYGNYMSGYLCPPVFVDGTWQVH